MSNCVRAHVITFVCESLAQPRCAASNPLLLGHRITRDLVFQHPFQCRKNFWILFLRQFPPPASSAYPVSLPRVAANPDRRFAPVVGTLHVLIQPVLTKRKFRDASADCGSCNPGRRGYGSN